MCNRDFRCDNVGLNDPEDLGPIDPASPILETGAFEADMDRVEEEGASPEKGEEAMLRHVHAISEMDSTPPEDPYVDEHGWDLDEGWPNDEGPPDDWYPNEE